jgi:tetratricopeptide (TPR) repeat protein
VTQSLAWGLVAASCASFVACSSAAVRTETPVGAPAPNAHTLFTRALAAQEADQRDQAQALWKQVIALVPNHAAPHTNLGIVYRLDGRVLDAITEYETAIRLDPADAAAYHNLGLAHRARGAWTDAERAYLRALELRPSQAVTHYNLGILYELFLNRPEAALTQYRTVVSLGGPDTDTVAQWIRTLERRLTPHESSPPGAP